MLASFLIPFLSTLLTTTVAAPTEPLDAHTRRLHKRQNATSLAEFLPDADIYTPSWPQWAEETQRWSTYSAPTFDVIFFPNDEQEVSEALGYLSKNNISFFAQGGGHGYSPTLAVIQDAVMVKMERFDGIRFNDDYSVTVGGAVRFREMVDAIHAAGRELTVGSCVCVGSTGAMLGGGHGRLQGKHGLTSDALRSIRLVLWNGTVVEASENSHSDLFWGIRGAGHNFGIVTESTYETYPQENGGLHYTADMVFSSGSVESVFEVVNSIIPTQDPALAMDLLFFTDVSTLTPIVFLNLVYAGPEAEGQLYADRFSSTNSGNLTTTGPNSSLNITRLSFDAKVVPFDQLNDLAAGGAITAACAPGARQNTYTANLRTFDSSTVGELFKSYSDFVRVNPLAANSLVLFEVFGQEAVDAKPDGFSAYPNRGFSNVLSLLEMIYTDDSVAEAADNWARQWRNTLASPDISGYRKVHVYENYAHGDEPLEAIYGYEEWRRERLTGLKNEFDPQNFFKGYHSIPRSLDW